MGCIKGSGDMENNEITEITMCGLCYFAHLSPCFPYPLRAETFSPANVPFFCWCSPCFIFFKKFIVRKFSPANRCASVLVFSCAYDEEQEKSLARTNTVRGATMTTLVVLLAVFHCWLSVSFLAFWLVVHGVLSIYQETYMQSMTIRTHTHTNMNTNSLIRLHSSVLHAYSYLWVHIVHHSIARTIYPQQCAIAHGIWSWYRAVTEKDTHPVKRRHQNTQQRTKANAPVSVSRKCP